MFWSQHLGCWGQNTSRIQNKEVYGTIYLQAEAESNEGADDAGDGDGDAASEQTTEAPALAEIGIELPTQDNNVEPTTSVPG